MVIDLKEAKFVNDFFSVSLPNGGSIVFNKIQEDLKASGALANINVINIQVIVERDEKTYYSDCTNIIGLSDNIVRINSDYLEYRGKLLTVDNMKYCTVEVIGA